MASAWVTMRSEGVGFDAQEPASANSSRPAVRSRVGIAALPEQALHARLLALVRGREEPQRERRRGEQESRARPALVGEPLAAYPLEVVPARRQEELVALRVLGQLGREV